VRGIIFTEFLEMVEEEHSPAFLEDVIAEANLASGGAYTAVGHYPYEELVALVQLVSEKTDVTAPVLLKRFGGRIFKTFCQRYHKLLHETHSAYNLFQQVENTIHREVKKLYPNAECPSFEIERHSPVSYSLIYNSSRPLGDLCEGMILAALRHHKETGSILRTELEPHPKTLIRFDITIRGGTDE
jgi:hypothetical protein